MLNTLVLRGKKKGGPIVKRDLAKTSSTPGRTQTINFFRVDEKMYFVDLPGYGYAKAPRQVVDQWRRLAETYLTNRVPLKLVVLIVDIRHGPTEDDFGAINHLAGLGLPVLLVLTKADKLRPLRRKESVAKIVAQLEVDESQVIPFSVLSGLGVEELRESVGGLISPENTP